MSKTPDVVDDNTDFTPNIFNIPAVVMLDKELQPLDTKVYAVIFWYEQMKDGKCWASNKSIADIINSSPTGVSHSITRLQERKYIACIYDKTTNQRKEIKTLVYFTVNPSSNEQGGVAQTSYRVQNNINKYTSEVDNQMQILHRTYVKMFKIDPYKWQEADTEGRKALINAAAARYKLTPARRSKIAARLKDAGFEMCYRALENANRAEWNHGENDSGWKMDLYSYLFRNYEMVERWANES